MCSDSPFPSSPNRTGRPVSRCSTSRLHKEGNEPNADSPRPSPNGCAPRPSASPSSGIHTTCRVHLGPFPGWSKGGDAWVKWILTASVEGSPHSARPSFWVLLTGGKGSWWSSHSKATEDILQPRSGGSLRTAPLPSRVARWDVVSRVGGEASRTEADGPKSHPLQDSHPVWPRVE